MSEVEQEVGVDAFVMVKRFKADLIEPQPRGNQDSNNKDCDADIVLSARFRKFGRSVLGHKFCQWSVVSGQWSVTFRIATDD